MTARQRREHRRRAMQSVRDARKRTGRRVLDWRNPVTMEKIRIEVRAKMRRRRFPEHLRVRKYNNILRAAWTQRASVEELLR